MNFKGNGDFQCIYRTFYLFNFNLADLEYLTCTVSRFHANNLSNDNNHEDW